MKKKLLHCARRLIEKEHNTYVNEDDNREDSVSQIYALILFQVSNQIEVKGLSRKWTFSFAICSAFSRKNKIEDFILSALIYCTNSIYSASQVCPMLYKKIMHATSWISLW